MNDHTSPSDCDHGCSLFEPCEPCADAGHRWFHTAVRADGTSLTTHVDHVHGVLWESTLTNVPADYLSELIRLLLDCGWFQGATFTMDEVS